MSANIRVRYAPSPTGHLHIGGARTAWFNYLLARGNGGKFIVRFEDTDQTRHVESGIDNQLDGLKWLGIDWDESVDVGGEYGPYRQMERIPLYKPYIEQLKQEGVLYSCYCSEKDLEDERAAQEARGEMPRYSGKCRSLTPEQEEALRAEGRKPVLRFRVPADEMIRFTDEVRGEIEFDTNGIGDFIVVRPDGVPMYNFAVTLDDHMMGITHVIRGEEHLSNTPRQIMIYNALGWEAPQFAHLSLILNTDRKKMSKRDESIMQFIEQYRDLGYLPEAVTNFITLLGWSPVGEEEIFSKQELIEQFSLDRVAKSPAVFDMDKLNWMNNYYFKKAELQDIVDLALPHLKRAGRLPEELDEQTEQWAVMLIGLHQEKMRYAAEIVELTDLFFKDELEFAGEAKAIIEEEHVPVVLQSFLQQLETNEEFSADGIKAALKQVQKETGYKGKALFMSIRVTLTGQTHGPDLNLTAYLLGKEKVIQRIKKVLS